MGTSFFSAAMCSAPRPAESWLLGLAPCLSRSAHLQRLCAHDAKLLSFWKEERVASAGYMQWELTVDGICSYKARGPLAARCGWDATCALLPLYHTAYKGQTTTAPQSGGLAVRMCAEWRTGSAHISTFELAAHTCIAEQSLRGQPTGTSRRRQGARCAHGRAAARTQSGKGPGCALIGVLPWLAAPERLSDWASMSTLFFSAGTGASSSAAQAATSPSSTARNIFNDSGDTKARLPPRPVPSTQSISPPREESHGASGPCTFKSALAIAYQSAWSAPRKSTQTGFICAFSYQCQSADRGASSKWQWGRGDGPSDCIFFDFFDFLRPLAFAPSGASPMNSAAKRLHVSSRRIT